MPKSIWMLHAGDDPAFASWMERVDDLCDRLLDVRFDDLISEADFDPRDAYRQGMPADKFVAEYVIPYLESEHGGDMVFEQIGESLFWGQCLPMEEA